LNLGAGFSGTGGTFTAGTGTVNYYAAGAQTVAGVAYYNLTLSGSGAKTTTGATVNGILSMEGTATTTGAAPTYGASATLQYKGSALQTTGVELLAAGVPNLTINNSYGVNLDKSTTISGTLTLTSGNINTGSYTLTIGASGSVSHTSGYVFGNLQKVFATGAQSFTFHIGDATNYTPVALSFANVNISGNVTGNTTAGEHPNISTSGINSAKDVNRYWTLTAGGGINFTTYDATFTFVSTDVDSGATPGNFVVQRYSGGTWYATTTGSRTDTTTQATGVSSLSAFAVGESSPTIEISAPGNITGWSLSPQETQPQEKTGTLNVTSNSDWEVTVKDTDTDTDGKMTDWDGADYGSTKLSNFMNVATDSYEVELPDGGTIATGSGNEDVTVYFRQTVSWSDPVLTVGHSYRIIVTFTGTIT
jgi:hypothetical protein